MVNQASDLALMLQQAKFALDRASDGHLPLPIRKRVLFALGEPHYEQSGSVHGSICVGLRRRVDLYARCTRKVMPIWNDVVDSREPEFMLELAAAYLAGTVSRDVAWRAQNSFGGRLLNAPASLSEQHFHVSYVGNVAIGTVLAALGDVDFRPDYLDVLDHELDYYENSLYAMAAYSGELPWGEQSDPNRRREFWQWWLDEAVPAAARSY